MVARSLALWIAPTTCERTVEPRTEALGEQVVGLTGGRTRRVGARVGTAEVQGEEGDADEHDGHRARRARACAGAATPCWPSAASAELVTIGSGPCSASARRSLRLRTRFPRSRAAPAKRQRRDHRDQDRQRGGDGDAVQERELQDQHAEQGDAHGRAGEEHGATRGVDRRHDGVFWTQAAFQSLSTSRHDEERVVDAHAQSDERAQNGRKGGDGEPVTEQASSTAVAMPTATSADQQRQQHREERAEGEHEDDGREDQSEDHVGTALLRGELLEGVAGELDVE